MTVGHHPCNAARVSTSTPVRLLRLPLRSERSDHPTPAWVFEAMADLDLQWQVDIFGNDDLHQSAAGWLASHLAADNTDTLYVIAVRGGREESLVSRTDLPFAPEDGDPADVLGNLSLHLPLKDNLAQAHVDVVVRADARRGGIGSLLEATGRSVARDLGRRVLQGWTGHRGEGGDDGLVAPTGAGSIARDAATGFALARGWVLEQTERHSILPVPGVERLRELRDGALAAAVGYRTESWVGATPEHRLDGVADLYRRMSTDIPLAGLELEEEHWDAERVRSREAATLAGGKTLVTTVALDAEDDVVAFSILQLPSERPSVAWQDETLVKREHRGHRLGMLVKAVNLLHALSERPGLERVHTWNAGENEHMLAINVELGFARASTEGAWQLRLPSD